MPLLEVVNLKRYFYISKHPLSRKTEYIIPAVDGVSLEVGQGETVGLVGESGCGKSTVAKLILRLLKPDDGKIVFDGIDIGGVAGEAHKRLCSDIQIVFQDPYGSLNPRIPIGESVAEGLKIRGNLAKKKRDVRVRQLLDDVGLDGSMVNRYPHEASGGQRQRIGIARALSLDPRLIILDEPISSLDMSVQAGIINLLKDLQEKKGVSYLLISHDLHVVRYMSAKIYVMNQGKIVEEGATEEIFSNAKNPYTHRLLESVFAVD